MSSRLAEKERRREERIERERAQRAEERRRRTLTRLALIGLAGAVLAAALIAILASGGSHRSASSLRAAAAFGPHYAGLDARRRAAHVPTMMQTMNSPVHFHPLLKIYVDGKQVPVPANVGIDPSKDPMQMAGLHTHDSSGTIHVEGVRGARLGQFFAVWGVPLAPTRLGPYRASGGRTVRMWVNGKPSTAFGALKLADRQRIVISYGPKRAPAPAT